MLKLLRKLFWWINGTRGLFNVSFENKLSQWPGSASIKNNCKFQNFNFQEIADDY